MPALYHYTCTHRAELIDPAGGVLMPTPHPLLGAQPLLWLTTSAAAHRAALGLSSHLLSCDRMACLYRLTDEHAEEVYSWAWVRATLPRSGVLRLEAARGARPALWWVSLIPQPAERVR